MSTKLTGPFIAFFLVVTIGVLAPLFVERFTSRSLPVLGEAPQFDLTDTNEDRITASSLLGKVWVSNFFFTSCQGPCPIMNGNLARVEEGFRHIDNLRFVSFTIDPETDTPEVLKEYGTKLGADLTRWHFLTGSKETLKELSIRGFKLGLDSDSKVHATRLVLIDKQGKVRGYYDGTEHKAMKQLVKDIKILL